MDTNDTPHRFDVVIIGGGSAGAVLANRLSANDSRSVMLLEAGSAYAPAEYPDLLLDAARVGGDAAHDWGYRARTGVLDRTISAPRGKVLGGSSAVNAAVALRARPTDFDRWSARGLTGWSFEEVLQTYRALENTPTGDEQFHGRTGPLPIRQRSYDELTPSLKAFIDASAQHGFARIDDPNADKQDGVAPYPLNVVNGIRQNTGLVYLPEAVRRRPNLTIRGHSEVDSVLFGGRTATGVQTTDGSTYQAGEVILSAGTFGSAAILLRSGIGPAFDLANHGIDVVSDLPVGQRLQDHPLYYNAYSLNPAAREMTPAAGAIVWTASSEAHEDELDLHISATHLMDPSASPTGAAIVLAIAVVQPESIGTVTLQSRSPADAPLINYRFLSTRRDRSRMLEGVKLSRAIARQSAFTAVIADELAPGTNIQDDADLARVIDEQLASYEHPTSTAPMGGETDRWAVVDNMGSVRGVTGLRVIDASILPEIPSTATNLTVIMVAEHIYRKGLAHWMTAPSPSSMPRI
ncbi:MAG: choline dehydrogenase [Mycobacterium sp.]|nr:choline dehydrogenase [Mycobacterium sp.]